MDFSLFYYHTCAAVYYMCCKYASLCCSYFSPLQIKNRPSDRDSKHAFILGPVSFVAIDNS
jgi:hypothetical protein